MKRRIDQLLVERGLAVSRHKAQGLILAGQVLAGPQKVDKPGCLVDSSLDIRLLGTAPFVSRAGAKLQAALDHFALSPADRTCADLGASTGGFTDCLLQNGARRVDAFDVGEGQLDWKLRTDGRVVIHDRFNVRHLAERDLAPGTSMVTADLSFISLTKILVPLREALRAVSSGGIADVILLVKPQFEVGKGEVGKGGIVRAESKRRQALQSVEESALSVGFRVVGHLESPLPGAKGNVEFLLYLQLPHDLLSAA